MTAAGKRDREITIEQLTPSQSGAGAPTLTPSTFAACRAAVTPMSASERFRSAAKHSARVSVFNVRYVPGVTPDMQIAYEGLKWQILGIEEVGRRAELNITAEAIL
jgi:SPP1 family predicted phage head-tail adaptor